jgi:starch synthase
VGGLEDSVEAWNEVKQTGTGFKFAAYSAEAFWKEIVLAAGVRARKRKWARLRKNAMAQDFSWESSVRRYEAVYRKVLGEMRENVVS